MELIQSVSRSTWFEPDADEELNPCQGMWCLMAGASEATHKLLVAGHWIPVCEPCGRESLARGESDHDLRRF